MLYNDKQKEHKKEGSNYHSDLFAMIGNIGDVTLENVTRRYHSNIAFGMTTLNVWNQKILQENKFRSSQFPKR